MVMSAGAGMLAALEIFGSLMALGPEDEVPPEAILIPAGVAAVGIVLACFVGAWSRWASGVLGVLYGGAGVQGLNELADWWRGSRSDIATAAIFGSMIALGAVAVAVAIRAARTSRADQLRAGTTPSLPMPDAADHTR